MSSEYRWFNSASKKFLEDGYLLEGQTVDDRVSIIANKAEEILGIKGFAEKFIEYFKKGWFSLSTPVWANFGTERGLPISCFSSYIEDSMESILYTNAEVGMMTKIGGGTSAYFGNLRSRGSEITNNGKSSGAVHFMQLFDKQMQVISQGSCYVEGTEVLTNNGFKDFRDVTPNDLIAEVDEFNNISFTENFELVKSEFKGKLKTISGIKRRSGVDIKITPNHRMVISKMKKINGKKTFPDYTEIVVAEDLKLHRDNRLFLSGNTHSGMGLTFKDRFRIAFQADGRKDGENRKIRFKFNKPRKIDRLKWILDNLNKEYSEEVDKEGSTNIILEYDNTIKKDTFEWIDLSTISKEWSEEFIEELAEWDGSRTKKHISYSSINEFNVDTVQAISCLCGKRTNRRVRLAEGNRKSLFNVVISDKGFRNGDSLVVGDEEYDGMVYCAVVPKGRLLVRNNGTTLICGNTRRGSFAAYLPIDHPDILEFLKIKSEGDPIQDISFGVCVSDSFMQEMIEGDKHKRKVWAKVLETRANVGYPYIFFSGNVNKNKPQVYKDKGLEIYNSNLCSEIALHTNENESFVCDLSSMNLLYYDEWKATDAVETLFFLLDAVMTEFIEKASGIKFMERAVNFAKNQRAIGLGVLGYHSYLQSKLIPFESMEAKFFNSEVFKYLDEETLKATKKLAEMFGEPDLLKGYGERNVTRLAIAPTKSSAFILGQVSEGIEPVKSNYYVKDLAKGKFTYKNPYLKELLKLKEKDTPEVWESILKKGGSAQHLEFLTQDEKDVFKTFQEISPKEIIIHASQRQRYIDQSQSLNLMIHPKIPTKDVNKLLIEAWELGVKTLYYQFSVNAAAEFSRNILECKSCEG